MTLHQRVEIPSPEKHPPPPPKTAYHLRNWEFSIDDICVALSPNDIKNLLPCSKNPDETKRSAREGVIDREEKKGYKKKLIHMDLSKDAPNLEFFSEEVRRAWEGKSSEFRLQSAAFSFACLLTGPTPYQPMDYYHLPDLHEGEQDEKAQSQERVEGAAKTSDTV